MKRLTVLGALFLLWACDGEAGGPVGPDVTASDAGEEVELGVDLAPDLGPLPYVATGDPYAPGALAVETRIVEEGEDGAPRALLVFAPSAPGLYPLVQFQHGFLSLNHWYQEILGHLASHGFVVVAPQMYMLVNLPWPGAFEEAVAAAEVLAWVQDSLLDTPATAVGLAGHSRGGKVSWAMLRDAPGLVQAVAGVDPVDGQGGPSGGEARVLDGETAFPQPSLVIGAGLGPQVVEGPGGMACAPEGDNHEQFWAAGSGPGWHVFVPGYGHTDMLDEVRDPCAPLCEGICPGSEEPALMRQLTGGLLAAFFRLQLQGDAAAAPYLEATASLPLPVEIERR